jgi:hypothetical protein
MLTLTGLFSWLKALTHSDWGYYRWWDGEPVRQFVLYEKELWMGGCLGGEPTEMGWFLLMVFEAWGGIILAVDLHD